MLEGNLSFLGNVFRPVVQLCPIITSASKCDQCFHESQRFLWNWSSQCVLIYEVEKVLITQIKCDNCPIHRLRTLLQSRCNDLSPISFPFFSSRLIVSLANAQIDFFLNFPISSSCQNIRVQPAFILNFLGVLGCHQTPKSPQLQLISVCKYGSWF